MYHGYVESPERIEERKQRILADYKPAESAEPSGEKAASEEEGEQ